MIFVFGRDGCNACEQTRKLFDRWKIDYNYVDVNDNNDLPPDCDCTMLPITVIDYGETICGFQYDKFQALKITHGEGVRRCTDY